MTMTTAWPQLEALQALLDSREGRLTAADVPLGMAVLREYLTCGAAAGKLLRQVRARMKPADPESIQLSFLFNLIVDGATHAGRLGPIESYAASEYPLAREAGELLTILRSPAFAAQVGWQPTAPGDKQPGT
jgi:hypothetical protein